MWGLISMKWDRVWTKTLYLFQTLEKNQIFGSESFFILTQVTQPIQDPLNSVFF